MEDIENMEIYTKIWKYIYINIQKMTYIEKYRKYWKNKHE